MIITSELNIDVVGLGKTITTTAVAKIMEDDLFYNTLIVCPKNLIKYRMDLGGATEGGDDE